MRVLSLSFAAAFLVSAAPSEQPKGSLTQGKKKASCSRNPRLAKTVTCMDPRIEMDFLLQQLNLTADQSYIIRNAGGRAEGALSSILVSQRFLETSEVHVIHHTQCGMADKSEATIRRKFYDANDKSHADTVNQIRFLPIRTTNYTESVLDDVTFLQQHPLNTAIKHTGWIYNIGEGGKDTVAQVYTSDANLTPPSNANSTLPSNANPAPPSNTSRAYQSA
ncbi:hypothetical protein RSOLAG22IIIB_08338 [Rhizoctonia solani]|uniref:Carbonic anhydrase n=1 Tax=Rhizoctonia solani TaxID=456999 RepID=A0A0K6FSY8_9AGAM|nr:hypothetical protein RSOLAG22IIIB_08338 [Rhizoctonia solani]